MIEVTEEDKQPLRDLLKTHLRRLRGEISHDDAMKVSKAMREPAQ